MAARLGPLRPPSSSSLTTFSRGVESEFREILLEVEGSDTRAKKAPIRDPSLPVVDIIHILRSSELRISVIIPTLNEEIALPRLLGALQRLNDAIEIIVADGGSDDGTSAAAAHAGRVVSSPKGRGAQQAAGASLATGEVLWFLHADCEPATESLAAIRQALADPAAIGGNFTLRFSGDSRSARTLSWIYPLLRPLGLCYGDSGIFVRRDVYEQVGGFHNYPLFEDVDLVRRLRQAGRFERLPSVLTASCRRFEHRNPLGMFAQWTGLQILYWLGASPHWLARHYAPIRERSK